MVADKIVRNSATSHLITDFVKITILNIIDIKEKNHYNISELYSTGRSRSVSSLQY